MLIRYSRVAARLWRMTAEVFADPLPPDFAKPDSIYTALIGYFVAWIIIAGLLLIAARLLQRRHGYRFIFAVACLECFGFPIGTVLGVFTLVVLLRPSVKQLFGGNTKL
jgi:hypothetical protein